ncbi:uncharacterized protein Tco025E_00095 [Trypanosoma conorhini]|uniref:Uncharacterized protein n=1 Tax=Trypanosoma conorhini TaxID=83891 RepID=A0A3R7LMR6_9TRYP|nr:uncharacterized protein Tco025E_00095 [Trypanosoma conorhini]RNF27711.1 hypothetical protein Tco025E_00095 [Trypanosoma conorhini]
MRCLRNGWVIFRTLTTSCAPSMRTTSCRRHVFLPKSDIAGLLSVLLRTQRNSERARERRAKAKDKKNSLRPQDQARHNVPPPQTSALCPSLRELRRFSGCVDETIFSFPHPLHSQVRRRTRPRIQQEMNK